MNRRFITAREAEQLLPDRKEIHTFVNMPFGLIGADWNREDIIDKLNKNKIKIEIAGEQARSIGHGLAVYDDSAKRQSDVLFIETDRDKLDKIDGFTDKAERSDKE